MKIEAFVNIFSDFEKNSQRILKLSVLVYPKLGPFLRGNEFTQSRTCLKVIGLHFG